MAEHQRWYDLEPTLSLAVSLMKNSSDELRCLCADMIIDYTKDFGVSLPDNLFSTFSYVLRRWYDEDKHLSEALEYLKHSPNELQKEVSFKIIEFLENKEMQTV